MNQTYIDHYVEGVFDLFKSMLGAQVSPCAKGESPWDGSEESFVLAIIGMSGAFCGNVVMMFPHSTATQMTSRLIGSTETEVNDTVLDAVAESVNIVAGAAKARLSQGGDFAVSLGLPTVVVGRDYNFGSPSWAESAEIGFKSELGAFSVRVSLASIQARKETAL